MHTPAIHRMQDEDECLLFMQRFSFATLVTVRDGVPQATHVPVVTERNEEGVVVTGHIAKENEQVTDLTESEVLVIFQGPHAYISPRNYDHERNVPTWNYVAVHAYGEARCLEELEDITTVLEEMIRHYEPEYKAQWDALPEAYKSGLSAGIIAFEIRVTELQGKKKLSQNKALSEQDRVIDAFSESSHSHERWVAEFMREERNSQKS